MRLSARVEAVLERIVSEAGADPGVFDATIANVNCSADPGVELRTQVLSLLDSLEALSAMGHLADLTVGGMAFLTNEELIRAEAIRSSRLPAPETDPDRVGPWQLHLEATEAQGKAILSAVAWQRLVEYLPLPVLDDLLDRGALTRRESPHAWTPRTDRVCHVVARIEPDKLSDDEIVTLGWQDEVHRRTLSIGGRVESGPSGHDEWSVRSALLGGELSVLDDLHLHAEATLPRDLARLIRGLRAMRRGEPVEPWLGRDRSLFGLMEDFLPQRRLIAGRTAFHAWAGARRMYRLLDDAHGALACEPDGAAEAIRIVAHQAAALRSDEHHGSAARADREARAVQAYLHFLSARPGERDRLDQAVGLVEDVLRRGKTPPGGVSGELRRRMAALSTLLQTLRRVARPRDVLNPYLALCVEHGSREWKQGWRDLRRQVPAAQLEYINGAKDRIQRRETALRSGERPEEFYRLPLDDRFAQVPEDRGDLLRPRARPLERRTPPSTQEERSWTAAEAARELIDRCATRMRNGH
ncbi:hypothetical protein [Streptomyces sp. E-08]|uniref:hypothetical protein n=1 Tax=Streptomyces sp. E-08 TaxID=3404047 RepID=UPI003CEA6F1A